VSKYKYFQRPVLHLHGSVAIRDMHRFAVEAEALQAKKRQSRAPVDVIVLGITKKF
jgi:hypothetical protein